MLSEWLQRVARHPYVIAAGLIGLPLTVLSLPSVPADIAGWGELVAWVNDDVAKWALPVAGWIVLGWVALFAVRHSRKNATRTKTIRVPRPTPPPRTESSLSPVHQRLIENRVEMHRAEREDARREKLVKLRETGQFLLRLAGAPPLALAHYGRYITEADVEAWEVEVEGALPDERARRVFQYNPPLHTLLRPLQPAVLAVGGGSLAARLRRRLNQLNTLIGDDG